MSQTVSILRGGVLAASLALAAVGVSPRAEAFVINMDFGPTTITSPSYLRSPYHATTGDTGNTAWNSPLQKSDITAGQLVYGDGTTASGVSVNVGVTSGTSSILGTQPSDSSSLGTYIYNGVYAGNSSAKDAIFDKGGDGTRGIALQISGLAAGTYDIYYVGRNTNLNVASGQSYTQTLLAGTSATTGDFDDTNYGSSVITYTTDSNAGQGQSNWVLGADYAMLEVTVNAGDNLNLAMVGGGVEPRGFLNALQIVSAPVPEPAAFMVLATGCIAMITFKRRGQH